jgi:AcrR family transcriptional regulator
MRRLAARLGVTPMALYNHVAGRHDLITGIVDWVLGGVAFPDPDESWQRRLRGVFIALRQASLEHPNVVPSSKPAPPSPRRSCVRWKRHSEHSSMPACRPRTPAMHGQP